MFNRVLAYCLALAAVSVLAGCASGSVSAVASPALAASIRARTASAAGMGTDKGARVGAAEAIRSGAWIVQSAIPLDATYHWSVPSSTVMVAKAANSTRVVRLPMLTAVQDCRVKLSAAETAELGAFPAAQADLRPTSGRSGRNGRRGRGAGSTGSTGGPDDWSAQETILTTGDSDSGDIQGIYDLYTDLVAALGSCASTAPGAKVTGVTNQGSAYAATISIPTSTGSTLTWHEYLAAQYGYLVELSVWVAPYAGDKPRTIWDGSSPARVLSALRSGPCSVTRLC